MTLEEQIATYHKQLQLADTCSYLGGDVYLIIHPLFLAIMLQLGAPRLSTSMDLNKYVAVDDVYFECEEIIKDLSISPARALVLCKDALQRAKEVA